MSTQKIIIIGAGVSGLSTGIYLLQNGFNVEIWAKDLPPNTTSNKAAALWFPYLCSPKDKAIPWARYTFEYLQKECLHKPETGCILKTMTELYDSLQEEPWWKDAFPGEIERPSSDDLPDGFVDGYKLETIVIDTTLYMDYLMREFQKHNGTVVQKEITNFEEALEESSIVINCSGLGSRDLCNDDRIYPVRGQMIKIKPMGFDDVVVADEDPINFSLVVPRVSDVMIGGTAQENNWNTEVDADDTKRILQSVITIAPDLRGKIEIVSEQVGLRPARDAIRLEKEAVGTKHIVHNYGHGGAGFTLSWGCAQDVVDIVKSL